MKQFFVLSALVVCHLSAMSQGITTGQLSGYVLDADGKAVAEASIILEDLKTNTKMQTFSLHNGKYIFHNVKPSDNYKLIVSYLGKETISIDAFKVHHAENHRYDVILKTEAVELDEVNIKAHEEYAVTLNNQQQGMHLSKKELELFPSTNRSLLDYLKTNPYAGATGFMGQGSRANYISIDGSGFNNVYGIGGPTASLIGNVVGAEPFGIDAIESIQFSVNPYDVRQSGFTGASINAITRSGSNKWSGSLYTYFGDDALVGDKVGDTEIPVSSFSNYRFGASLGGPLIKNRLFFFVNVEANDLTSPATNFLASRSGIEGENVTRVLASDLDDLTSFLDDNYGYETGPYEGYNNKTSNEKILVKLDWMLNDRNRFSIRYNYLNASMESNTTNSGSFGSGNRVDNLHAMSYRNSGQLRTVNAHSIIGELFSSINSKIVNRMSLAYSYFPDSREIKGSLFPSVDILKQGRTYISFGSHLFASENRIDQSVFNFKNEMSTAFSNNIFTVGINLQLFNFEYNLTPAYAGSFVFNSLEDFYNSTPIGTLTPIGLSNGIGRPSTYARRYGTSINNGSSAVNPGFSQYSVYFQNQYQTRKWRITGGIRLDYNVIGGSPLLNEDVSALTFQDVTGSDEQIFTDRLPESSLSISPRLGFSFIPGNNSPIAIRGGIGIFSGLPSMVRAGDQFINNGLLQGEVKARNNQANQYPFSPDPDAYIPDNLATPATYDINYVTSDYKPPQLLRSNISVDYALGQKLRFSVDATYSKDLYRDHVRNVNLDQSGSTTSAEGRFIFKSSKLNNPPVLGAYILDNVTKGDQYFISFQLKKDFDKNWFGTASYTYGQSKDLNSFGASTTRSSFRNLPVSGNTNDPAIAFSDYDLRHKFVLYLGKEMDWLKMGKTSLTLFFVSTQEGRFSYTYAGNGDINKDGVPSNDLIYIPNTQEDIALEAYNQSGNTISVEVQWQALDQFISNSDYLSAHRGQIAERNGSIYPWLTQAHLKLVQHFNLKGSGNRIEFIVDFFNFTNLLNQSWGVRKIASSPRPIQAMQNGNFRVNPSSLNEEFINDADLLSRWQLQFGVKYRFE